MTTSYIEYLLEANFCLVFFLVLYWFFLREETNFRLVRFIMVGCIIVSLAFPLLHVNVETVATIPNLHEVMPSYWLPVIHVTGSISYIEQASFGYTLWDYITIIYIAGVIITAAIFIFQMITLLSFIRRATFLKNDNSRIIDLPDNKLTFSFFNYIFLGNAENLSEIERQRIIDHENTHVKQFHSLDILLITFLKIVFWFNPFIHLYKKIFVQLHEFEADARAVRNHDVNMYCSLLARVALQSAGFTIANHFNNSLTLKRIHMMRTIKTRTKWWKVAACALALPLLFFVIACQDQAAEKNQPGEPGTESTDIFTVVEKMPEYKGGYEALTSFIQANMKYPEVTAKAGIGGTVYVSFTIDLDGKLSDISIAKGVDPSLDAEALRMVNLLSGWIPGEQNGRKVRTRMTLPIKWDPAFSSNPVPSSEISHDDYQMKVDTKTTYVNGKKFVSGSVRDEKGNPLLGANVIIYGTTSGTSVDDLGNFRIELPDDKRTLVVSFVGYETEKINL